MTDLEAATPTTPTKALSAKEKKEMKMREAAKTNPTLRRKLELLDATKGLKPASTGRLLREAKGLGWLFTIGVIFSMAQGIIMPLFAVTLGGVFNVFGEASGEELEDLVVRQALGFVYLGLGGGLVYTVAGASFSYIGDQVGRQMKIKYFHKVINNQIGWYDARDSSEVTARLTESVAMVPAAVSDKLSSKIAAAAAMALGIGNAFYYSWKLSIALVLAGPLVVIGGAARQRTLANILSSSANENIGAVAIVKDAVGGIRTVKSFRAEDNLQKAYGDIIGAALKKSKKKALLTGFGQSMGIVSIFMVYAIGFGYGGILVARGELFAGDLLVVFFSLIIGLSQISIYMQVAGDVESGKLAGALLYSVIDDPAIEERRGGETLEKVQGHIRFEDVHFNYPSRPDSKVLQGLNIDVVPGTTVALCGHSGCGKSTVVALLQGFYEAASGSILIDGKPLKSLDLSWVRNQTGVVSQEPSLFNVSIKDNLLYGKPDATPDELEAACRQANAWEFISGLADGLETLVGEKGVQLSGGQKQRVAIARALLKDPKILLLDEATSALDTESEKIVQDALDKLMVGRTSIVIAHRLSTIRDADKILVLDAGRVVESGTYTELMEKDGHFVRLNNASEAAAPSDVKPEIEIQ